MEKRWQRYGRLLGVGLLAGGLTIAGSPAQAAPTSPPPPPEPLVAGPWPPSRVLADDPAAVSPPDVAAALAVTCPPAPSGVNRTAPGNGRRVALTFDDGPGASTEAIIRILQEHGAAATFFNIGVNMTVRPDLVQAEAAQQFLLGNHTWAHPDMATLSAGAQATEMDDQTNQQLSLVGSAPCFFRPPYGSSNSTTLSLAQARSMAVYNWSVDTEDWMAEGSADPFWVNRIISLAQAGGAQTNPVILMHNQPGAMPATVAALPSIIAFYRDRGYVFVDLNGQPAARQVAGDWDGNGTTTPGLVRGNVWFLRNSTTSGVADATFTYGDPSDRPVTGDWDGNGTVTPGVVRGNTWFLRNSNSSGIADVTLSYGASADRPITGDWDGNGTETPGVVRGNTWFLRNSTTSGVADAAFGYGDPTDFAVTGDWDGNGTVTPGVVRGTTWYLRNGNSTGIADVTFTYGLSTDRPLTGDWNGDGTTGPGVTRGPEWFLRTSTTSGVADTFLVYG
jgi:peptidoglycan/xylan/chitin deacetylase (PgdA/CDA1 family)